CCRSPVTSIAERPHAPRPLLWVRGVLLILFLLLGALGTPWPWSALWLAIPAVVAGSLLAAWRFGRAALATPMLLLAAAIGVFAFGGPAAPPPWFTMWLPVASFIGTWMGLREE